MNGPHRGEAIGQPRVGHRVELGQIVIADSGTVQVFDDPEQALAAFGDDCARLLAPPPGDILDRTRRHRDRD